MSHLEVAPPEPGASGLSTHGLDLDRVGRRVPLREAIARRLSGRYPVDPFGGDPLAQDQLVPVAELAVSVSVEHAERIPPSGPAVLVANRGFGILEPAVLGTAIRRESGRRLRVVGVPELPVLSGILGKVGMIKGMPGDLRAVLRAGHLAALPLGPTGLRTQAGSLPTTELLTAVLGYRVIPVAVVPEGPLGLPLRSWRVLVGPHVELDESFGPGDLLGAAELAEMARRAVQRLLDER